MGIHLLPEDVASRIAAGEVVERPASVVKELVENSLDAGASRIEVETRDGGVALVRVRDDGEGIPSAEAALAFRRHATSKLTTAADLERIRTLGFRGEALASIAAVSCVTCTTRYLEEEIGIRLRIEGGSLVSRAPVGRPPGTELVVEDLFYNVPARRKFLHTARTERRHIDAFLTRYAIAYPTVAFLLVHDGREILRTAGTGNARETLAAVYGPDLGRSLLEIPPDLTEQQDIRITGFVGPPTVHRANRGYMTLFVNGRWIEDVRLSYAIVQAYHTLLPVKRYPVAFVMVNLPSEAVDVNVHPAKAEVRFRDPDTVFRAVQRAVRTTVIGTAPAAHTWTTERSPTETQTQRERLAQLQPAQSPLTFAPTHASPAASSLGPPQGGATDIHLQDAPPLSPREATTSSPPRQGQPALPPLRVIGQLATLYIIAEGPDGLYLIDQHAAHERVLYERMRAQALRGDIGSQPLLQPVVVSLPQTTGERLAEVLPLLKHLGLEAEVFGPATYLVRTVPAHMTHTDPASLFTDMLEALDEGPESPNMIQTELEERLIRRICKRAAVKAGQVLSQEEMARLIRDLEATENPRTCPHGRPTIVQIPTAALARQFNRDS